jgi:hypothetical protein
MELIFKFINYFKNKYYYAIHYFKFFYFNLIMLITNSIKTVTQEVSSN